jgi:hypothetical protein
VYQQVVDKAKNSEIKSVLEPDAVVKEFLLTQQIDYEESKNM